MPVRPRLSTPRTRGQCDAGRGKESGPHHHDDDAGRSVNSFPGIRDGQADRAEDRTPGFELGRVLSTPGVLKTLSADDVGRTTSCGLRRFNRRCGIDLGNG